MVKDLYTFSSSKSIPRVKHIYDCVVSSYVITQPRMSDIEHLYMYIIYTQYLFESGPKRFLPTPSMFKEPVPST